MSRANEGQVKNRSAAPIQISAEQIIREAADRQEPHILDPVTKVHDAEEYQSYLSSRRKHFEDNIRYRREHIGNWVKYARFEEENKEYERSRSVFERALEVEHRSAELWLRYAEFEMRNEFVNRARNVLDRGVQILPRVDFLWYKYAYMEEMVGDAEKCREVFERWMNWCPDEGAWLSYARFEVRCAKSIATKDGGKQQPILDMATEVMKRYVNEYPCAKSFLKLGKWAEHEAKDISLARTVYESALVELEPEEARQARVFKQFSAFEERQGEYQRARVIYQHAIKLLRLGERSKSIGDKDEEISSNEKYRRDELYKAYVAFEKKHGQKDGIENVILTKQRAEYNKRVESDPNDYDAWFEYAKLEEDHGDTAAVREVYERAISNVPPAQEKQYWKRYIYLWIYYAIYEELEIGDMDRATKVYDACLEIIPHAQFSFAKIWVQAAKLHVRKRDLDAARKLLGKAIGLCGKEKIFIEYISLELTLGEIDRCRALYNNYLKAMPHNCKAWSRYADLERSVGETDRCRALYELAVSQQALDMPEVLWKGYIDFEIEEGEGDMARGLYERLLERTGHVKVWISFAQFEGTEIGRGVKDARDIFDRAYNRLKEDGLKEERVLLLDAWRVFEKTKGDTAGVSSVEAKMPRRIKKKRMQVDEESGAEIGWEEYFDYHFPDDEGAASNLKILDMAAKWKQAQDAESSDDSDSDSD
uniref:Suppressor of forked domain-containing protein n=1 Tax=Chaetoceros debilis TaxID=122233 RepID=A0A7S3V5X6_9STRA|mmetsp:Transcript_9820/g.14747  ORF Transcript_9820/g.14747 Transcript_9820/m.14747 type:complete len:706 (+) Transcript_9820:92-2209(+)|eukprot:CAMPEP_0194088390 /NCGR_PEP_ID=MMETSP0149-20130528/28898_1 /TAXON_ID=122233 /ORGANISM="Chaetoceros debilis, Strain MM31A-1" /LENGTH=705 /DNA_ID=CAMNT_0038772027 /DNA_START=43 /DNA_END=2160 /DNA_ORIENTATION=+